MEWNKLLTKMGAALTQLECQEPHNKLVGVVEALVLLRPPGLVRVLG